MTYYCTLADAKATMRADSTLDDALLLSLIGQVSARIDLLMSTNTPYFQPYTDALEFEVVAQRVGQRQPLEDPRHAGHREHEAREQQQRHEDQEAGHERLLLRLRDGREGL